MNTLKPAALFRKEASNANSINDMVNSVPFKTAVTFALAEYAREVGAKPDAGARVLGANEFIDKLLNIGIEPTPRKVPTFGFPADDK